MVYSVEDVCQDGEYAEKNTHCNAESFGIRSKEKMSFSAPKYCKASIKGVVITKSSILLAAYLQESRY